MRCAALSQVTALTIRPTSMRAPWQEPFSLVGTDVGNSGLADDDRGFGCHEGTHAATVFLRRSRISATGHFTSHTAPAR